VLLTSLNGLFCNLLYPRGCIGRDGFVRAQESLERRTKKHQLVEEMIKEKQDKQKRKSTHLSTSPSASSSEETSSTTKASKTRRIAFNKSKNKFFSVRYARGGGSRTLDVPLDATKQELIEMGKDVFFAEGVAPIGKASDFPFGLANFKGEAINKLRDSGGHEQPFTIQGYFETYKLTRVHLYLTCQACEDSDDEVLMTFNEQQSVIQNSSKQRQGLA